MPTSKQTKSSVEKQAKVHKAKAASPSTATITSGQASGKPVFSELVHGKPVMGIAAVRVIRAGFPAKIMKSASAYLGVTEARIHRVMHVPSTTASRLQKQNAKVDAAATERVLRISDVTRMAIEVFEDEDAAKDWLRQPNEALDDSAPLDLLDTEPGAVTVKQVLNAIATGGVV